MTDDLHFVHVACAEQPPIQYRACGLDNVYLRSGYSRMERDGETYTSVEDADDLHKAIAAHLAMRKKNLRGREIRFLRKYMDLTQAELGQLLGVSDQSVARYEKEQTTLEGPTDTLFRIYVVGQVIGHVNPQELVERIRQSDSPSRDDMVLEHDEKEWKVAA